jgi:5-(carboxyamino)imidazole ribonucleotide synthase
MLEEKQTSEFLEFPIVIKSRRLGYDGQGTFIVRDRNDLEAISKRFGAGFLMLEEFIPFERELAVMAARNALGEVVVYPVVETYQKDRVCHWTIAPAAIAPEIQAKIETMANHLLEQLQAIGIFGIELFLTNDGRVLVNEIAPRTHNSGHYTLDACEVSQFEMQLRAIADLPLGSPAMKYPGAVMVNLLGYETSQSDYIEKRDRIAALPHAYLHWYSKNESRPGRKLGHVTVLLKPADITFSPSEIQQKLLEIARQVEAIWYQ